MNKWELDVDKFLDDLPSCSIEDVVSLSAKAAQKKLVEYLFRERRGVQPLRILHLDPLEWQALLEDLGVK